MEREDNTGNGAAGGGIVATRARELFSLLPVGVTVTQTRSRRVVDANPRYAELVGRPLADVIGADWTTWSHPDDVDDELARHGLVGEVQPSTRTRKRVQLPDGGVRWVEVRTAPVGPDAWGTELHIAVTEDVTDHQDQAEKLHQLVAILEASPDYVATVDRTGRILWANATMRMLTGVSSVEDYAVERKDLFELLSAECAEQFLVEAVPQLWSSGAWVGEIEGRYPDGSTFPLSFSAIAHFDESGYPQWFSGIGRDITAAKATEAALASSERRMRTLVDSAPIGIFETNPWGACTYVNPTFCAITRISDPADALGFGWGRVLHPEDAGAVGAQWAIAIKTDQPFVGQFRFVTPDGDVVWADVNAVPVKGDDGTTQLFLGTVTDVTERLALERAQFEASELFRTAFDDAPTGMVLTGVHPDRVEVLKCNQAYASILGVTIEEAIGLNLLDITAPEHLEEVLTQRRRLLGGEIDSTQTELQMVRRDGRRIWVSLTRSIVRDSNGAAQYAVSQVSDITAERQRREQIERFAFTDPLTGLPNRRSFLDRLERACRSRRDRDTRAALLFIDLDRFKTINDRLGHDAGDALLIEVAQALTSATRAEDTVARLGGDEFAIIVTDVGDLEMRSIAERLMRQLSFPRTMPEGDVVTVTASIGLAWAAGDETVDEFLRRADLLMYQAKQGGRDQIVVDDRI